MTPLDIFSEETANLTTSDIQGIKRLRNTEAYHIIQFLKNQASLDFSMSWLFWSSLILQVYEDTQINVCMSVQRVQLFYKRPVSLPYKDESIRISRNSKSGL